jgi:DNA invertase Pin-like site-specific DNA recombinase
MTKIFAYCRVSSKGQVEKDTIANQKMEIKNYLQFHPELEVVKWYEDGLSAFKDRPQFNEMWTHLDEVEGIIINKLTRIGRDTRQLLDIADTMKNNNKQFIVVNDNIDTFTPQGKMWFTILAGFAEYEAALIKERMSEGRRRAKMEDALKGVNRFGRPKCKFTKSELLDIKSLYEHSKFGIRKIATHFSALKKKKVSASTIRRKLVELGVQLREF